jgi:hypothetical protein
VPAGAPGRDPLYEVLLAQGYCAAAETPGCLSSDVPLDLSGVSDDDRVMIENLLSVPDPEFTVAP